jgi:hypothetical protein
MAKHRGCADGTSSIYIEKQLMEQNRMKYLKGFWHSVVWALEMKRRVDSERIFFDRINPESITDIDRFLREKKLIP